MRRICGCAAMACMVWLAASGGGGVAKAASEASGPLKTTPSTAVPLNDATQPTLWQQERKLIKAVEQAQGEHGLFSSRLIPPMHDLAAFYIACSRCESAIPVLLEALKVSRATEGLFNPQQTQLLDPLLECYLALDLQAEFEREQRYLLLLAEQTHGKDSPGLLPALDRTAHWYERAGRYISARYTYNRAVKLARKAGGKRDLRMVEPLRGIARAYRLEYVHGLHDADAKQYPQGSWISDARLDGSRIRLDAAGESALKQALKILRSHPNNNPDQFVGTLLELADWNHMKDSWRAALGLYKEAWSASAAGEYTGKRLFVEPEPIFYRTESATLLRQLPYEQEKYDHYWVDFKFTVTRNGQIRDLAVTDTNAPEDWKNDLTRDFRRTRYRPQFEVGGDPVDSPGCHLRQGLYVKR